MEISLARHDAYQLHTYDGDYPEYIDLQHFYCSAEISINFFVLDGGHVLTSWFTVDSFVRVAGQRRTMVGDRGPVLSMATLSDIKLDASAGLLWPNQARRPLAHDLHPPHITHGLQSTRYELCGKLTLPRQI